jgi:hypothetical protein
MELGVTVPSVGNAFWPDCGGSSAPVRWTFGGMTAVVPWLIEALKSRHNLV